MDCSPPGSSVHGIPQARVLEWVATSFSRGSSRPRDRTWVSHIAGRRFTLWASGEARPTSIQKRASLCWESSALPPSHFILQGTPPVLFPQGPVLPPSEEKGPSSLLSRLSLHLIHFKVSWLCAWPPRGRKALGMSTVCPQPLAAQLVCNTRPWHSWFPELKGFQVSSSWHRIHFQVPFNLCWSRQH